MLTYEYENKLINNGYKYICGIDEAGRGPLAGNVVAAAVILPTGLFIEGLDDSKKLSEKKREALFEIITREAVSYCVAWATPAEIDSLNILNADMLAMRRAAEGLSVKADAAIVDGNIARGFNIPAYTLIGGDGKSPSVAAASILAKVTRDRQCKELDEKYPEYGFSRHKGYPTKEHMAKVIELGPCPEHRRSFLSFAGIKNEKD